MAAGTSVQPETAVRKGRIMYSPIKYRGYLPRSQTPVYGNVIERRSRKFFIYTKERKMIRVSAKHLCLFTGCCDTNGEELYEEDWVTREHDDEVYQLQFRPGGFWLVGKRQRLPMTEHMKLTRYEQGDADERT